jgi:uncharacterized membrane protein YcaP (DUF421 family)
MDWLWGGGWREAFVPTTVLEVVVRGTIVYLVLFALFRLILKRQSGALGVTDLLVVVLVADAAQNAMAGGYTSLTDGIILVAVIVFWSWFLDWLGFRFPRIQRLMKPPPLPVVRDGRLLRRNMKTELITEDELFSQLRLQGVDDLARVRLAAVESDGRISVVTVDGEEKPRSSRPKGL